MAEHFNTNKLAIAAYDILFYDATMYFSHLVHIKFASQHYYIGKLSIETQCFNVRDIELSAKVHLYALRNGILHYRHVGSNDSTYASLFGIVDNLAHEFEVLIVDNRIDSEVGLNACLFTTLHNAVKVFGSEVARRT